MKKVIKTEAEIKASIEYRQILKEEQLVYDTFIAPFSRLFTAIKLTAKTVLNIAGLAWGMFTLSPSKMEKARTNFEGRQKEIEAEWKPVIEESEKYLKSGEAALASLIFAPAATITAVAMKTGFDGTTGTLDALNKSGLRIPLVGALGGLSGDYTYEPEKTTDSKPEKEKSLLQKIAGLFYIESSWLEGDLILEAESGNKKFGVSNFKKELPVWLNSTGIMKKFKSSADEYYKAHEEPIQSIIEDAEIKISVLNSLSKLSSFDEAKRVMAGSNMDSESIMKNFNVAKEKIKKDKNFTAGVPKEIKKKNPTPEEINEQAEKAVLKTATTRIQVIKEEAKKAIDSFKPKDLDTDLLSTTNAGKKFIQLFNNAKLSVDGL